MRSMPHSRLDRFTRRRRRRYCSYEVLEAGGVHSLPIKSELPASTQHGLHGLHGETSGLVSCSQTAGSA